MNQTMKELLEEERPYEKCGRFGAKSLTDIELLAVLLRSGTKGGNVLETAKKILYPSGREGGLTRLPSYSQDALMKIPGIGKVKAIQILCLCEMARRIAKEKAKEPLSFDRPETIASYYICLLYTSYFIVGCTEKKTEDNSVIVKSNLYDSEIKLSDENFKKEYYLLKKNGCKDRCV